MKKSDVLIYFGCPSAVAKKLGVTAAAISKWGDLIPKGRAYELEKITKGKLKANPNLYLKPLRD
ncbi:Cro/CI family transcriptional regulator [Rheinheimera sp. MMS21-TC3]|uniref:Cro/CI family transcriptional regulator n=1 Tax=Rheinheimera sp. MMS21-TC3 TaxID=3072790 RepID=UPI0028C3ECF7|nr:Cro/CI family transcriptional regulator [Rheinheimera sp. MMS21-TC3]WNO60419.1 Cro/CI family transcriptional regulator [Rheinheimera sp. MMS21-TC3]